ncbi:MAG: hypothetical protein JST00_47275 [Deltaproteobacteria bacterium]|nr:hypothetical protein [Deltaproteobacteria bacterium]
MRVRTQVSLLVVAACLALAPAARADEPTAADAETALALYKDGKALREKGELPGALEKLKAAHALVETPITALELGKTYVQMGKLVEAREVLLSVSRIPVRKNESTKASDARTESEALAAQVKPRLASLTVRVKGATPGKVQVDGVVVPPDAVSVPRILNPGSHVVVLDAGGKTTQTDVTLAEGEARELEIAPPEASAPPVVTPPPIVTPPPAPVVPPPTSAGGMSPLVPVGFTIAGVGIVVGAITGAMTLSSASTVKDACTSDGRCPSRAQSDIDAAKTTGTISTLGFVIGLAGAAVGVAGLFVSRPRDEARGAGLRIVPTADGFGGTF